MKKEIIIVVGIIIFISILNVISQNYTKKSIDKTINNLNELRSIAEAENEKTKGQEDNNQGTEQIDEMIEKIKFEWKTPNYIMSHYIEHDEIEKVNSSMAKFETAFSLGEYTEGITELENCKYILRHIKDKGAIKAINLL